MLFTTRGFVDVVVSVDSEGVVTATSENPLTYDVDEDEVTFLLTVPARHGSSYIRMGGEYVVFDGNNLQINDRKFVLRPGEHVTSLNNGVATTSLGRVLSKDSPKQEEEGKGGETDETDDADEPVSPPSKCVSFQISKPVSGLSASGLSSIVFSSSPKWVSPTELTCETTGFATITVNGPDGCPLVIDTVTCDGSGSSEVTFTNVHAKFGRLNACGFAQNSGLFISERGCCASSGYSAIRVRASPEAVARFSTKEAGFGTVKINDL